MLKFVAVDIKKVATNMREPIRPDQRLANTLRCLVTGGAHTTIGRSYRTSSKTVGGIFEETCNAICNRLEKAGSIKTLNLV